jgi:hypothetical protein
MEKSMSKQTNSVCMVAESAAMNGKVKVQTSQFTMYSSTNGADELIVHACKTLSIPVKHHYSRPLKAVS